MANSVVRLSIDSHEFDANIKRAGEALNKFFDQAKKGDRTFEVLDDDAMEVVKTFGKMETSSKSARGQLSELTKGFTDLSLIYKRLSDEEKASPVGKEMARSLDQLKTRIQDTKKDLASINQELSGSKFGQFGGIIDGVGRKMGVNANLTELLTSKTALMTAGIGAAVAAIYKGTEAWAKYNAELSRQDQQTQVITGLKGSGADHMTDVMRAVSDTYKVDFRQAVEAANTLMSQFGVSGSEAIQLIKDGMQGMIQGDGPKLLSMIQQYAPAFRDAGVSASQLVAVIHNSEGGIFTDQNMSAIVMGMKNIRLMTKQTSEALAKLGIDGNQMSQQLSNGTLTVFDALKQVASELKNVDSNSKTAGEVMQTVFGRQGAMAGTNLAKAIETLNTNLEETKKQTGDVGDAFADLQTANEKLNTAIRDCFEYDGWEQMATGIKANLVDALADVLEKLADIKGYLMGFNANQILKNVYGDGVVPDKIQKDLDALKNAPKEKREELYKQQLAGYERRFQAAASSPELKKAEALYHADDNGNLLQKYNPLALIGKYYSSTQVNTERAKIEAEKLALEAYKKAAQQIMSPDSEKPIPGGNNSGTVSTPSTLKTETQQNEAAIAKLTDEYVKLATAANTADEAQRAGLAERMTAIQGEIKTLQDRNAELKKFADEAKGVKVSVGAEGSLPQLAQQLKDLQQAQGQSLDTGEWVEYQKQIDATSTKIDILKGKWKDGQVATFSFEEKQPDKMVFTADNQDVLTKLAEIREAVGGIEIDDKTLTVTANTAEAVEALRKIDGLTIQPKAVSFIADNAEVLDKLREVNGVSIDDKTMTVTANTAEAYNKVQELIGSIEGTTVSFEVQPQVKPLPTLDDYRIQAMIEIDAQNAKADTETLMSILRDSSQKGIDTTGLDLTPIAEQIGQGVDVKDDKWQAILDKYNELRAKIGEEPIEIDLKTGKLDSMKDTTAFLSKEFQDAASAVQGLGSALSGIGDGAVNVVGIVAQAVANVALSFSKALASEGNIWTWIAAAATGTASMVSTISAIKNATAGSYANGGIIPGNSYSGDNLIANVNAGELILSRAAQNNIASQLQDADMQNGGNSIPYVSGEMIFLGLNNWGRRTGRGELVFSRG
jgi:chaperonin cofactor prefoldin